MRSLCKGRTYKKERSDLYVWPKTHKPANVLRQKDVEGDWKDSRLAIRIQFQMHFAPVLH